jgi:hypothetical protein
MPQLSRASMRRELRKALLTDADVVDCALEVVAPDGRLLLRVGGRWDTIAKRYVPGECKAAVVRLEQSQVEADPGTGKSLWDGFAAWLAAMDAKDDARPIVIMACGNRGSGKTFFLGSVAALIVAIKWPKSAQFSVNLSGKQKREVIAGFDKIAPPEWTLREVTDARDPFREFITEAKLFWRTGKAPAALREGGITFRYGFVNEGQDQHQDVALNAVGAIRNVGGLVGIATNPDPDGGWVGDMLERIEGGPTETSPFFGERYILRAALNSAIDQATQPKIAAALYSIDPAAADADAKGLFVRRGAAYPAFTNHPRRVDDAGRWLTGHIGQPPHIGWRDVTREETAKVIGAGTSGYDWIGGSDFQVNPGCCIAVGKLYRDLAGELVLYIHQFIGAPGREAELTQAIVSAEYFPAEIDFERRPRPGRSLLIVGDGTGGSQQDASHRRGNPYSFEQLAAHGWTVIPPMRHFSTGKACNPLVLDSIKQMHSALSHGRIMFSPACGDPAAEFPSLIDGFKKTRTLRSGKFEKKGHWTHGPDGVRYLAWRFLPRSRPLPVDTAPDASVFSATRAKTTNRG